MKKILFIAICFLFLKASAQESFDGKKWEAPYRLNIPKGWGIERFLIPATFAPSIHYKGVEDIRFTPGWGKAATEEYWSYAFLWYLDGKEKFTASIIEKNLVAYYSGIFNVNTDRTKIDTNVLIPVRASIKKSTTYAGDLKTFKGTVNMNDYMTRKPVAVNLIIHIRSCEGQDKTFVFYEVSPKPYEDAVWTSLNQLWLAFKCSKH